MDRSKGLAMLSERERRELADIEQQLALEDPRFVLVMRGLAKPVRRLPVVWFAGLVAWIVATTVTVVLGLWLPAEILAGVGAATVIAYGTVRVVRRVRRGRTRTWRC
ncbi:MAG TPA: DUF3040 domain-containing protein [Micromonosporaceae bacterium]|nr:DUF3040 domain-containing protein [Micromonosporaceae bacterium]